jgi:hypothetical protein
MLLNKIVGIVGIPVLAALAVTWASASTASAQTYGAGYTTLPIITAAPGVGVPIVTSAAPTATVLINGPTTPNVQLGFAGPGVNEAAVGSDAVPAGCALYDSWCVFCSSHSGADVCAQYHESPASTNLSSPLQDAQPDTGAALRAPIPLTTQ